jgi:hypothetical protein
MTILAQALVAGALVALAEFALTHRAIDPSLAAKAAWLVRLGGHWILAAVPFCMAFAWLDRRASQRAASWPAYAVTDAAIVAIVAPLLAVIAPALLGPGRELLVEDLRYEDSLRFLAWQLAFWGALGAILHRLDAAARRSTVALRDAELDRSMRERRLGHARLRAACARVVPEFLLAALRRIEALYGRDASAADRAITTLVAYLRLALAQGRDASTTLAAEARLVEAYLAAAGDGAVRSIALPDAAAHVMIETGIVVPSLHRLRATLDGATSNATEVAVTVDGGLAEFAMRVAARASPALRRDMGALERELAVGHDALRLAAEPGDDGCWTLRVALPART